MEGKGELLLRLGAEVKARRQKLGLSQEELGLRAGLDRTYVGGIERGERNVSVENLRKIAHALDLRIHELMLGVD